MITNTNRVMANARVDKKDEFYTKLETIEEEIIHYKAHFKDKVVYMNCDNPKESQFFKFFLDNFEDLELKKIIASCYIEQDYNLFNLDEEKERAFWASYSGYSEEVEYNYLKGDGDFRSQESIELLKEADIVVTNPPFSLFKEYINQLMDYDKKFLIIGNTNAITYKEFFNLIKDNEVWPGSSFNKSIEFKLPSTYSKWDIIDEITGAKYATVPAISWWTNLDFHKRDQFIELTKVYKGNEDSYPKYYNFDAINVDKVSEIPLDYEGIIGAPITFIGKYNPLQFEILGLGAGNMYKELNGKVIDESFLRDYLSHGGTGNYVANQYILGYYNSEGKPIIPYMRLLIRNRKPKGGECYE